MLDWLQNTWNTLFAVIEQTVTTLFPLINTLLVVIAGCFGSMLFGKIKPTYRDVAHKALGIAIILMGVSEAWDGFFVLQTGQIETSGTLLVLFSLLFGYVVGRALSLDRAIGRFGVWMHRRFAKYRSAKENTPTESTADATANVPFDEGFILAAIVCVFSGPTIHCTIESQMGADVIPLLIKLGFDIAIIFVLAALYGSIISFAAVPMLAVEGVLLYVTKIAGNVWTPTLINQLTLIGAVILIATGISLGLGKKLRTANLIPAFLMPAVYGLLIRLTEKPEKTK